MKAFRPALMAAPLLLGLMAASLPGCGGGGGSQAPAPGTGGPPPGPAAAAVAETVEGVDGDGDGVRDDVEAALHARHPGMGAAGAGMAPAMESALMQGAKGVQMAVVAGISPDPAVADEAALELGLGASCLVDMLGEAAHGEIAFLEAATANTAARSAAYNRFNDSMDGRFFSVDHESPCEP